MLLIASYNFFPLNTQNCVLLLLRKRRVQKTRNSKESTKDNIITESIIVFPLSPRLRPTYSPRLQHVAPSLPSDGSGTDELLSLRWQRHCKLPLSPPVAASEVGLLLDLLLRVPAPASPFFILQLRCAIEGVGRGEAGWPGGGEGG